MRSIRVNVGDKNVNNAGSIMEVLEVKSASNILVTFIDYDFITETTCQNFEKGLVKCPYEPRVCNIGYLGVGKYMVSENGKDTRCAHTWRHMLKRCYDAYWINKHLTYKDCFSCEEWYNFQNFAKWYEENYYEIEGETMCLDKDILIKGNKIYSPETCIFVPQRINLLFVKKDNYRGNLPVGVTYEKDRNKYVASCSVYENKKHKQKKIGRYNTLEEAFTCYKNFKENYIKQVADEYKNLIPTKLYDAMYRYEVEIND